MKELSTGIDMAELGILDDDNPRIEVDWHFIRMVLVRLRKLKEIAPEHLAENNIPEVERLAKELLKLTE